MEVGAPIDETAQALYLGDPALLPPGCATHVKGTALLEVLHAEHFARLSAEYGASILRDPERPKAQRDAVLDCRVRAKQLLGNAWRPLLSHAKVNLEAYTQAATNPLFQMIRLHI